MTQHITVTDAAQQHFVKLLSSQPENTHIRVFVVNPGTAKAECGVSYCPRDAVEHSDTEIPLNGFSAFIDATSYPFLVDAFIDLQQEAAGTQLTLKAPNAKAKPLSDDAPLFERVEYVLQSQINPNLASHGGFVKLTEITEDRVAVIQFGGGCNGCSMVDVTLKDGVEKELMQAFADELSAVRDVTAHARGEHSYM